ncbi:MAG: zinc ribbon domain-containing protein [Thaumarchaeota archaeon]|jgi:ribosomal protein L40E|nr:zinc ribbon domain-containing protein [Candidatus Terraquivivens yellowstonensis]
MGFYRASIILCAIGIAIALIPTVLYIAYSQELSFLKTLETEVASGIPLYLVFSFVGVAVTLVGLITFVRAIRHAQEPSAPRVRTGTMPRIVSPTPTVARPTPTREAVTRQPPVKRIEEVVESIEKELEEAINKASVEQPTPPPKPQQEVQQKAAIKVITAGTDEVCPSCGAINPLGQKKCTECGADIYVEDPNLPSCPVCDAPLKNPQKLTDKIYVCRVCFSELEIPKELSKKL